MGIFNWFRSKPRPPSWASAFESRAAFEAWIEVVEAVLAEGGDKVDPIHLRTGELVLERDGVREPWLMWSIAERCATARPEKWRNLIANDPARPASLRRRAAAARDAAPPKAPRSSPAVAPPSTGAHTFDLDRGTLEDLTPILAVQLWSRQGRTAYVDLLAADSLIKRELADGLFAVVVYDLGGGEQNVPQKRLAEWGVSEAELFERAAHHALAQPFQASRLEVTSGAAFMLIGNGAFVAALALQIGPLVALVPALAEADRACGWIVAVPNWHALVIAPASGDETTDLALARELRPLVERFFDYHDAVSPELFRVDVRGPDASAARWTRIP